MKTLFLSFFAFIGFIFFLSLNFIAYADSSLVASYSFNENSGLTAGDSSGNSNNGSISNATWNTGGKYGSALSFNGTNSIVSVNDSNSLDLTTGMTIEAWVKPTTLSSWRSILVKERPNHLVYALYANTDTSRPSGEVYVNGVNTDVRGTSQLPINTWTHVAVTFDGSNLKIFINGVQSSTKAVSGSIGISSNSLRIGGNTIWGEYFNGLIDEVRIYNKALTDLEIENDRDTPL